jgi:hypothetical protein
MSLKYELPSEEWSAERVASGGVERGQQATKDLAVLESRGWCG